MKEAGIDYAVILPVATKPAQFESINRFAAQLCTKSTLCSFGGIHPDCEDIDEKLDYIKSLGLRGIKLHPDYQGFFVDDPKMKPLYRKISELGLITVFHAGVDYGFAPPYGAPPDRMAKALLWLDSPVVAAHWGGLHCYEGVLKHLCGTDVYLDTAFGYGMMPRYFAEQIVERHGVERLLFGTDTPWHTAEMERRLLNSLGLSEREMSKIAWENALWLLNRTKNA
jgi:predicted TIM-barrel fold metal-dependent hydrolase